MKNRGLPTGIDERDRKYPSFKIWLLGGSWRHKYGKGFTISPPLYKRIWTQYTWNLRMRIKLFFTRSKNDNSESTNEQI